MNAKGRTKKPVYVSAEERAKNREIAESYAKRFPPKRYKAEILYARDTGCEFLERGRYVDAEAAERHAAEMLAEFNRLSTGWRIGSVDGFDLDEERPD